MVKGFVAGLLGVVAVALPACAPAKDDDPASHQADAIVAGEQASGLSEAVLIDANAGFMCSGAVIAPRVVLTAGHCVPDASSWTITAPYAKKQRAKSTKAWTEYKDTGESVNPNSNDIALLILDTPIELASYPTLSTSEVPNGTKAFNVGRIRNNKASSTALFRGELVTLGTEKSFPFSYVSDELIEAGDSGGPVYVGTGNARTIVAVNSGSGGGTQVLARVDLAYAKIQKVIEANGGAGAGSKGGDASSSSSSSGSSTSSGPSSSSSSTGSSTTSSSSGGAPTSTTGECWSSTLQRTVPELTCVESAFDEVWCQCKGGLWYRGGDGEVGRFAKCTTSYPLDE